MLHISNFQNQLQSKWNLLFSNNNGTAWISFKPQLGRHVYPCYACGDMFVSKVTFQDHTNRRALMIKYHCTECNQTLTFYNRCSFLLHARSHFSLTEGKIDFSNIEIYNLPFEMMGFLPYPGIKILFDVNEDSIEENCYINTQFYSADEGERGKQIITLKPNDLLFSGSGKDSVMIQLMLKQISNNIPLCQFVTVDSQKKLKQNLIYSVNLASVKEEIADSEDNLKPCQSALDNSSPMPVISKMESLSTDKSINSRCPECEQSQRCSMKMHFVGKNVPLDEKLKCSLCKYVASTKCSYLAHERIHSNIAPFICPECGKKFESREYLMKHLDDVCFHLAKQVRIRCPGKKCGKLFASTATFSSHFAQHIHTWMQCSECKECFESLIGFSEHAKVHSNPCSSDTVFKCLGCKEDGSIIYQDNVSQHLDHHTGDRSRYMYVFVCKFCRNYFRSTTTYAAHLLKCLKMHAMIKQGYSYSVDLCVKCQNRIIFYDYESYVVCSKCRCINEFRLNQKSITSTNSNVDLSNQNNNSANMDICLLCKEEYSNDEKEESLSKCNCLNPEIIVKTMQNGNTQSMLSDSGISNDCSLEKKNDGMLEKISSDSTIIKDATKANDPSKSATNTTHPGTQESLKIKRKTAAFMFCAKKNYFELSSRKSCRFES